MLCSFAKQKINHVCFIETSALFELTIKPVMFTDVDIQSCKLSALIISSKK